MSYQLQHSNFVTINSDVINVRVYFCQTSDWSPELIGVVITIVLCTFTDYVPHNQLPVVFRMDPDILIDRCGYCLIALAVWCVPYWEIRTAN